jgi:hypothetical protein
MLQLKTHIHRWRNASISMLDPEWFEPDDPADFIETIQRYGRLAPEPASLTPGPYPSEPLGCSRRTWHEQVRILRAAEARYAARAAARAARRPKPQAPQQQAPLPPPWQVVVFNPAGHVLIQGQYYRLL